MAAHETTKPKVEYGFLGRSGLKVSNICLGTMTFGTSEGHPTFDSPTQADEGKGHEILDKYAELGGNFIDTADMYSFGQSEQIIGSWLSRKDRNKFVVATKCFVKMSGDPNDAGLSRRHMIKACNDSLSRLGTDYIDLYQSHAWDTATPIDETLRTVNDLIRCGKIRYFGVSNVSGWQMQKIVDRIEALGLEKVISLQQQYNLLCRHSEWEEFQVCREEGIGVLTWSPLKGGMLTGRYKRGDKPGAKDGRIGHVHQNEKTAISSSPAWTWFSEDDNYWNLMDIMHKVAANHGKSVPQVAIRWLLQRNVVSSVIVGATSTKQLEDNMGAGTGWKLTMEEMNELDEASKLKIIYPYDQIARMNSGRYNPFNRSTTVESVS